MFSEGVAVASTIDVPDYSGCFVGIRTVNYHFFCLLPEAVPGRTAFKSGKPMKGA